MTESAIIFSRVSAKRFKQASLLLSGLVFLIGCLAVIGWVHTVPILTSFASGLATIKINTAIGLMLIAISLALLIEEEPRARQMAARICGGLAALLGLLTLLEYVYGTDVGLDDLLFSVQQAEAKNPYPARMAPMTALGLLLEGSALVVLDMRRRARVNPSEILVALAIAVGLIGLVGHLYGAADLYRISVYSSMSIPTSLAFVLAGAGIVFARPAYGFPALLLRRTQGSLLALRLLPAAIAAPLLLGWLRVMGERAGLYGLGFGTGIFAVTIAALFVVLIWWTAFSIDKADRDRKAAESELRRSEEGLRFMSESMPQKIFMAGPTGGIDYINHQWMEFTGAPMDRIRDWGWLQFVHPDDVHGTIHRWKQSVDTGKDFQIEHRLRRNDGMYRWHLSRARAMHGPDGKVVTWVGSNTEIHDQKLVQQELLRAKDGADRANRAKDEFLAVVSHELRTPLTSILGWARLLLDGKLDEDRAASAISVIERNATTQAQLIEDLLDVARMISGKLALTIREVDVARVTTSSVAAVMPAAAAKQITIEKISEGKLKPIAADPIRLQQVFWNLLHNAIKFSPKGSHVEIKAVQIGSDLRITVKDWGCGIDPAVLPHVFERFWQADSHTTREHGGLGLGLTIVRYLVEAQGGVVHVESPGPGKGTTFSVDLPVEAVAMQHAPTIYPPLGLESEKSLAGLRLLIVEDDGDARELVRTILSSAGASVIAVPSGDEALVELDLAIPDIIVSDIGMPGKDGYQLLQGIRLRDEARGGQLPAIALTAYARNDDRIKALQAGFQLHLPKPVDPTILVHAIARLATSKQKAKRVAT